MKLKNFLYPITCFGCDKDGTFLCVRCQNKILPKEQECPYCQRKSLKGAVCTACKNKNPVLDGLFSFANYTEEALLIKLIHAFKYDLIREIHEPLAQLLGDFFRKQWFGRNAEMEIDEEDSEIFTALEIIPKISQMPIIFCPVPLHVRRERQRGFNQAELLLKCLPDNPPFGKISLLKRISFKRIQKDLNREERIKNVEGAFSGEILQKLLKDEKLSLPETVILVDDIATTLATLEACGKELKKNGVKKVYGLVLARKK